jgi:hypothetical protein
MWCFPKRRTQCIIANIEHQSWPLHWELRRVPVTPIPTISNSLGKYESYSGALFGSIRMEWRLENFPQEAFRG